MCAFLRRHPELSLRTTLQLGKERAVISPEKVTRWFVDLQSYLETEVKDPDLMKDPSRIYNADESGFSLCPKGGKVLGSKGTSVVYNFSGSDKSQLTVMSSMSATGHYPPPMIVYPGQRFAYNPLEGFESANMGRTLTGWMDSDLFCEWLKTTFIPAVDERRVTRPLILFIDGHSTHLTLEASTICKENGIVLYCLLAHASHLLQPLDLRLFSPLKENWRQSVRAWQLEHIGEFLTKRNFASVFKSAWEKSCTIEVAVNGFRDTGLFPLNSERVMSTFKMEPSKLFADQTSPSVPFSTKSATEQSPSAAEGNSTEPSTNTVNVPSTCLEPTTLPSSDMHTEAVSNTAAPSALEQFEKVLGDERIRTFERRYEEGYDLNDDEMYNVWREIKKSSIDTLSSAASNLQTPTKKTKPTTESPFSRHLKVPVVTATKKPTRQRVHIPKAITGDAFRKILIEKKAMKEKEEADKKKRKEERIEKQQKRKELSEKKKAETELRKRQRQQKNFEKERQQIRKAFGDSDESDEMMASDPANCFKCDAPYIQDNYIQCDKCFRRFHMDCVEEEEMLLEPFECKYC